MAKKKKDKALKGKVVKEKKRDSQSRAYAALRTLTKLAVFVGILCAVHILLCAGLIARLSQPKEVTTYSAEEQELYADPPTGKLSGDVRWSFDVTERGIVPMYYSNASVPGTFFSTPSQKTLSGGDAAESLTDDVLSEVQPG